MLEENMPVTEVPPLDSTIKVCVSPWAASQWKVGMVIKYSSSRSALLGYVRVDKLEKRPDGFFDFEGTYVDAPLG
jgi:hypothetical protein